jgi:hypothetical protein
MAESSAMTPQERRTAIEFLEAATAALNVGDERSR